MMEGITFCASSKHKDPERIRQKIVVNRNDVLQHLYDKNNPQDFFGKKRVLKTIRPIRNYIGISDKQLYPRFLNGFVGSVVNAYNRHHNLIIKPDHVWMAILSQFSFYVQARAEELREKFVNHDGKKELVVYANATLETANMGELSKQIINVMKEYLQDEEICKWLIPSFTTTTDHDKVCYSVAMMGTMQNYLEYKFCLCCGIPNVTLLGTVEDWEHLRGLIDNLLEYDRDNLLMKQWHSMLAPVLDEFVNSRKDKSNLEFWNKVCSHLSEGSGTEYLSGWITSFCVFNKKGAWQAQKTTHKGWNRNEVSNKPWPIIDFDDVPSGIVQVPVTVDDNGTEYKTKMFAGCIATGVKDEYTIGPENGWCMFVENN